MERTFFTLILVFRSSGMGCSHICGIRDSPRLAPTSGVSRPTRPPYSFRKVPTTVPKMDFVDDLTSLQVALPHGRGPPISPVM